jgi:predicted nucleic acid-binding protein
VSYLLDTNVISELRKGRRANASVLRWFAEVPDDEVWLSVLVVGELRQGAERVRRRDPTSARRLDHWIKKLVAEFEDRILVVDRDVAELWGTLNVPDPLPAIDGLLAATALTHDLVLVTRNGNDVATTGVRIVNPFA